MKKKMNEIKAVIEVWPKHKRAWLKVENYTVGEAIASIPENLEKWAWSRCEKRLIGIEGHIKKLKDQISILEEERGAIKSVQNFTVEKTKGM